MGLKIRLVLRLFLSFVQPVCAQPFGGRDPADLLRSATCSATVSVRLGTDCKEAMEKRVSTMLTSRRVAYLFLPDFPPECRFRGKFFVGIFVWSFFAGFFQ